MRTLIAVALLVSMNAAFADAPLSATQNPNALYRLFNTQNIYNLLLLNTMDGSIQRLQWGGGPHGSTFAAPLPKCPGATQNTKAGRYTLQSTQNIWTFILLDQDTGSAWYVQWSMNDDNDFCVPVPSIPNPGALTNPGAFDIPNTPPTKP
jgi:hypothetical protein